MFFSAHGGLFVGGHSEEGHEDSLVDVPHQFPGLQRETSHRERIITPATDKIKIIYSRQESEYYQLVQWSLSIYMYSGHHGLKISGYNRQRERCLLYRGDLLFELEISGCNNEVTAYTVTTIIILYRFDYTLKVVYLGAERR